METIHLESPAKINLRLEILRKREDGYHEIRTIFQKIDLYDTICLSLKKEKGISILTDHPDLPVGRGNLAYQAARTMLQRSCYRGGVRINIEKRIPVGAGLGGGSSDAATTIKAMNQLLRMGLRKKELMETGSKIGADVPFFFMDGAAIGRGIGERLRTIELPGFWFILVYPNFEVSTRWAYQNFVLTKRPFHLNFCKFRKISQDISSLLWNDLEGVVSKRYPQIHVIKDMLYSAGARGVLMTGSGPTVFGVFQKERESLEAFRKVTRVTRRRGWTVIKAKSLPS